MYRTIQFRAKRTKSEDAQERFIEGSLLSFLDIHGKRVYHIVSDSGMRNDIQPDTIGEYTGLKDKNGTPIFEGDIVSFVFKGRVVCSEVAWCQHSASFYLKQQSAHLLTSEFAEKYTIIGNIYDNPEFLKTK